MGCTLPFPDVVDSFLYQYLVGGAVFGLGLGCGFLTGQLSLSPGVERRRLIVLCAGLLFFVVIQGAFVLFGK